VLREVVAKVPGLDANEIGDVVVGCAMPEAEQGMNVARIGLLLAGLPDSVPGITINRFCASGLQAVADAASRIRLGEADVMIAAGTESMSAMPQMMGNKVSLNPRSSSGREPLHRLRHGPHRREGRAAVEGEPRGPGCVRASPRTKRACAAIAAGQFADEILPYTVRSPYAPICRRHGAHHRAPGRARRRPASADSAAEGWQAASRCSPRAAR
jgi:acetyl-CoA acyltransferase